MKTLPTNIKEQPLQKLEHGRKCAGMTLVEALVAIAVFAVFMTGASKILMSHRKVTDMARSHYVAINIAKNRMELVRTFGFDHVHEFLEDKVLVNANGLPSTEGDYRRTTQISNISVNLVELFITIDIRNRKSLEFSGEQELLTTYIANYLEQGGGTAPATPSP